MADNDPTTQAPPDPAAGPAALVESFFELADAADDEDFARARANWQRVRDAWTRGWEKGLAGLAAEREAAASGQKPAPD
jgi:hypothetical protein